MMRETGRDKKDVGRMRFKVKDEATKSGTNHKWRPGKRRDGLAERKDASQAGL